MSTQPIDYAALAKQYGATSSQPAGVDYAALAKQYGATSSQAAAPSWWDKIKATFAPRDPMSMPGATRPTGGAMPGSFEGHTENVARYLSATGGDFAEGAKDIWQGNVARGAHKVVQGAGNAMLPALPFAVPAVLANPGAAALAGAGGAAGQFGAKKGAEALGATPDQADLAGDVGGLAGGYGGAKLPGFLSKLSPGALQSSAGGAFNKVSQAAGANAVDVEGAGQAALGAKDLQDVGRTMPRVMQKFLARVTAPDAEELTYDEARKFYSAAGELSANEKAGITPAMRRQLNQFKANLGNAIQETADRSGVGTEYGQAMSDYAKAKRLQDNWDWVWKQTKNKIIPGLIGGGAVGAGYKIFKDFSQ